MKRAVLRRKLRGRKQLTYMYLKLNRKGHTMKDSNDNATLDWIDEVELTANERKFLEDGEILMPTYATPNPALNAALNTILSRTVTNLLNK